MFFIADGFSAHFAPLELTSCYVPMAINIVLRWSRGAVLIGVSRPPIFRAIKISELLHLETHIHRPR